MARINLIDSFQEFKEAENIDRPTLMKVMEDVFKTLIRKKYGSDDQFDVIVNDQKGDLEIFRRRTIVDDGDIYNCTAPENFKVTFLVVYNNIKLVITAVFFADKCFKHILHNFHQRWTINVFSFFKFLEG